MPLSYDDVENTLEPEENLAHLKVFKDYIAKMQTSDSDEGIHGQNAGSNSTKKMIKKYALNSLKATSSSNYSKTDVSIENHEQSGKGHMVEDEENDEANNDTIVIDEVGKGKSSILTLSNKKKRPLKILYLLYRTERHKKA